MAIRDRGTDEARHGKGTGGGDVTAADRPLGEGVRVVTRRTVVDGVVTHEVGFERRLD